MPHKLKESDDKWRVKRMKTTRIDGRGGVGAGEEWCTKLKCAGKRGV